MPDGERDPHEALRRALERDVVLALKAGGFGAAEFHYGEGMGQQRRTLKPGFEVRLEHYHPPTAFVYWRPRFGMTAKADQLHAQHEKYAAALQDAGLDARVIDDPVAAGVEVTRRRAHARA